MGRPGWYYDGHPPACTCVACNEGGGRSRSTATATYGGGTDGRSTDTATQESGDGGGSRGWKWVLLAIVVIVVLGRLGSYLESDKSESEPTPALPATAGRTDTPIPSKAAMVAPIPAVSNGGGLSPHLRHIEEKRYMLALINAERKKAGVPPVELGDNIAAQLHAESALANCFSSHWGIDGLKPYMRYSLAGGYQSNSENASGSDYCIKENDWYEPIWSVEEELRSVVEGLMDSPGHRETILDKWHKKVNIGLAWDAYNFPAYQHFEGDYVEYDKLPSIDNGLLSFSGRVKNGASFHDSEDLGVQIYYDLPPYTLTRGQVARTYCYDSGLPVALLREPLSGDWYYDEHEFTKFYKLCPDPYDVPANAPVARSHDEAVVLWKQAYRESESQAEQSVTVPAITAFEWIAQDDIFLVTADIEDLLMAHGNGVYTIVLWSVVVGEDVVISEFSIFHGNTPPDTYTPL